MTVIVPEINPQSSVEKIIFPPANEVIPSHFEEWKGKRMAETEPLANVQQYLNEETTFTAILKNTPDSISMVFSKNKIQNKNKRIMVNSSIFPGSDIKVVSCGRRRSVDKQYKPSQPTNSGGNRGSTRRSGRYQNYDNNSSNGNSGADGNGEDNDDSDDDDDDEYIDEDDDDDEEEEEEEEEEEDEDKNEDEEEEESSSIGHEKSTSSIDSINEKLLNALNIKGSEDPSVVLMNSGNSERVLAPAPSGTPVTLEGVVCHETMGGVLVVNIKWRNKIYCGSLMDCTRHSWARPRFQCSDSSNQGKTRLGKSNGRGKGKGRGKRLRSNSVTRDNANNHTVSPLKQKLRGRKKTISGSSADKRTGFRSSKRKAKNNDDDSDDSLRPGKRSCTIKGAPSPQPSPTLIECPEPGCEKKYKHINGLRYHQAHAHLESKNQYDDANSDDRSSTTPSPSDEFKEPDPRITTKAKTTSMSTRNRSESPSITQDNTTIDTDNRSIDTDSNNKIKETKNEPMTTEDEPGSLHDTVTYQKTNVNEAADENLEEQLIKQESNDSTRNEIPEGENCEKKSENFSEKLINDNGGDREFVEVADKSTDTRMMNSSESEKGVSYPCEKHAGITIETVLPASEVPEVADTQEVWETVLDSGCIGSAKYEETGSVDIEDVISSSPREAVEDGGKTDRSDKEMIGKEAEVERRQIMYTTSSINQLGIEVEDISENEEDIDPGQDTEFNSQEEMEKAVENLQNGSFVASMSTENNLQMLSSLKDPSLIFGLTNRDKSEEGTTVDCTHADDMFSVLPRNKQLSNDDVIQISENMIKSELAAATRPLLGVSGEIQDQDENKSYVSELSLTVNSEPEPETMEKPVNSLPSSMSVENLVSRSISVSKLQPPLTNTDNPSNRFKYFTCRSYGDETYSQTASNFATTSAVTTTLALIRDPEQIRQDTGESKETNAMNVHKDPVESLVENVGPSFTGSAGFDQECVTLSIHTRGVKEEHKGNSSTGDIISNGSQGSIIADKQRRHESSLKLSYSSPKTSKATTSTTYNFNHCTSKPEKPYSSKSNSEDSYNNNANLEEWKNQPKEPETLKFHPEYCIDDVKKDDDRDKQSSRLFLRQPPTLIPKHNRPTAPTLPVGVAHPYQYSTVATSAAVTTGLSVTSPGHQELCRPEPVCHNTPSKTDTELESKVPTLKKVVTEKAHPIPVGEVGPVAVKRPAIHAGLPTVIPVVAPALKSQGALHSSIRQGLKLPGQEERSSTPGGLSSRLSTSSPRSLPSSPRPLSTSPRLLPTKANTSETKSVRTKESFASSEKPVRDDIIDNDVVIIKEEHEPTSDKVSAVDAKKMKDRERSLYHPSKEQLTPEKIHMYQLQQRQMYQAGIEAYLQSLAGPWAFNMSPEQMKLIQQHHYHMRADEDLQVTKNIREDPNKIRLEKRESISPTERRTAPEASTPEQARSTTPKQERPQLITGATPPGEISRSSTSEGLNRGMLRLTPGEEQPEKRSRGEYSKSEESEREIQKLRHEREEKYLYKQSMQHKFTMLKQLENAGGAAKTHSIPPLTSTSKDRLGDRDDDFPKSKYSQRSTHSESLPKTPESSKLKDLAEMNQNDLTSRSRESIRDSIRDTYSKPTAKHTWASSSSSRHSDTPPSERSSSVSSSLSSPFRPTTQFQAYLQHNFDPTTGNPVLMQTPMGLMQPQMPMDLGGIMNLSSTSIISSSSNTSTSLPSRLKERDHFSPYKGVNADQSPSSPLSRSSRSSRSRSPSRDSSPIPTSLSKSSYSRNSERARSSPSHIRTPSSSPSLVSRSGYRSVSPGSHLHKGTERMSNSATVVSRSSHRSSERSISPSIHAHKESYRVPTSSPSRSSVLSRGERPVSPRGQSHNEYLFKQRSESSSNVLLPESLSKAKAVHDSTRFRSPERHESESILRQRPGIISNNLAVRRGDVTPSMLMAAHSQEDLIRRHQYMLYIQQQQEQAAYAMMSSKQQNATRSDSYYGKRQ